VWCRIARKDVETLPEYARKTLPHALRSHNNLRETAQDVSTEAKNLFWFVSEKEYRGKPQELIGTHWQTLEDDTLKSLYDNGCIFL
jgi:hypothetical protein